MGGRQLALPVSSRESILFGAQRGAVSPARRSYILEGDGAFDVFASEHGGILPLYEYPDVRGHGRVGIRRSWAASC